MLGIVTPSPAALRAATSARRGEVKIGPALIWISPAKFLVPDPVRDGGIDAEPPLLVLLVILEIALEPFDVALALERQHVGGDAVEEPAVVADDDRAAGEILERLLERAQGVDIEVVGRLVEEEHIGAGFEHLGEMHPVALAAGELADLLLLVRAAEIERRAIGARIDLALAEREQILAAGDLLPYAVLGLQRVARLVDVAELDRLADADCSGVGLLLAGDHAEQRGLSGAVGADHPDDAARRQFEAQILDQQIVAIALGEPVGVDDVGAEPLRDRNDDLGGLRALVGALGDELLVGAIARLGFRLPRARRGRDPLALPRHGALARFLLAALLHQPLLLLLEPGRIIALVGNAAAAIELEDPAGDVVEEIAVVGDDQDRARIALEMALEPGDRLGVEVVGGLVEQQQVGRFEQEPAQRDAALLAASSCGSCGRNPTRARSAAHASPENSVSSPAMIRSSVDFPEPLGPSTPILASG